MHISDEGLELIKHFEGCPTDEEGNAVAYQDAVGVWTIGYGHTKDVKEGMTISKEQADKIYRNAPKGSDSGRLKELENQVKNLEYVTIAEGSIVN